MTDVYDINRVKKVWDAVRQLESLLEKTASFESHLSDLEHFFSEAGKRGSSDHRLPEQPDMSEVLELLQSLEQAIAQLEHQVAFLRIHG